MDQLLIFPGKNTFDFFFLSVFKFICSFNNVRSNIYEYKWWQTFNKYARICQFVLSQLSIPWISLFIFFVGPDNTCSKMPPFAINIGFLLFLGSPTCIQSHCQTNSFSSVCPLSAIS